MKTTILTALSMHVVGCGSPRTKDSYLLQQDLLLEIDGMEAMSRTVTTHFTRFSGPEGDCLDSYLLNPKYGTLWLTAAFSSLSPGTQSSVTSFHIPVVLWEAGEVEDSGGDVEYLYWSGSYSLVEKSEGLLVLELEEGYVCESEGNFGGTEEELVCGPSPVSGRVQLTGEVWESHSVSEGRRTEHLDTASGRPSAGTEPTPAEPWPAPGPATWG